MAIKDVLAVNSILLSVSTMDLKQITRQIKSEKVFLLESAREKFFSPAFYLIPKFDIESKIDMEVLMMIVVENAIWLPRLPKGLFESDARVINDSMVIRINHDGRKGN